MPMGRTNNHSWNTILQNQNRAYMAWRLGDGQSKSQWLQRQSEQELWLAQRFQLYRVYQHLLELKEQGQELHKEVCYMQQLQSMKFLLQWEQLQLKLPFEMQPAHLQQHLSQREETKSNQSLLAEQQYTTKQVCNMLVWAQDHWEDLNVYFELTCCKFGRIEALGLLGRVEPLQQIQSDFKCNYSRFLGEINRRGITLEYISLPYFIKVALVIGRYIRIVLIIWIHRSVQDDVYCTLLWFYPGLVKDILGLELITKMFQTMYYNILKLHLKINFICTNSLPQKPYPSQMPRAQSYRLSIVILLLEIYKEQIIFMFLFSCCTQAQNNEVYQLRTKNNNQFNYSFLDPLDNRATKPIAESTQVIKVKTSEYPQLIKQYKNTTNLWEDFQFPHNNKSLGEIGGITDVTWKRLSSIINNSVLFDGRIEPQDVVQGSLGDCYFLSAVSALAQQQSRITAIFGQQEGIKNGIYKVTLRINGVIEEILVDDYVPINSKGEPLFCQPNKQEIWVPILEKAWAKANGSYANIVAGSPVEIFRAATYAPAETLYLSQKQDAEPIWKAIIQNAQVNRPCCCGTDDSLDIDWNGLNLVPGHAYTLVDAAELETRQGKRVRMLKLRNPWGNTEWKGQGCQTDTFFWKSITNNEAKSNFLKDFSVNNDGIFYISFADYCKYFSQTHICHMEQHGNYIYQNFLPQSKRGIYWSLIVFQQGQYWVELHQRNGRKQALDESTLARATLVVARLTQTNSHEFVNGILSQYKEDCSLMINLKPGKYVIFSKFDINKEQILTSEASISIYSLYYTILQSVPSIKHKKMLQDSFLEHARKTKRTKYQKDTLWISYKLFYKEGGYAYICFGVQKHSKHQWEVKFNESEFKKQQFKLKKPFKGKGDNQVFKVRPGQQKIIVVRIMNNNPTNLKFPPKLLYKIQPI